jgi:hypothetical protein
MKELLKHVNEIPAVVLEELVKNAEQLAPDVIAALLASKDLPPAIREKLVREINSNKKLKEKLKGKENKNQSHGNITIFCLSIGSIGERCRRCRENCTESKTRSEKTKSGLYSISMKYIDYWFMFLF